MGGSPLRILLCTSEVAPFTKTGGLADVVGALAPELQRRGHDVRIATPLHGAIDRDKFSLHMAVGELGVPMGHGEEWCAVQQCNLPGCDVPVYFFEHERYFARHSLYLNDGVEYDDNAERFTFLSRACCQLCKALGFAPDVVHSHDWQTALVPIYLKTLEGGHQLLSGAASIHTIHNLGYQGIFPKDQLVHTQLGWELFTTGGLEFYDQVNFLKGGILYADKVSTVSRTYAREIQTLAYGWQLDGVLRARSPDLVGILNGCDYREWDPAADSLLPATFEVDDRIGKQICKEKLQERFGLPIRPDVPLIGMVSRLAYQKGIDVLAAAVHSFLEYDLQLAVLGAGEVWAHFFYGGLPQSYPEKIGVFIGFDEELAHLVYAGSDFFLMPSRYEPCGLSQMASMRYGSLPIVRATGGLRDTVENYDEVTGQGTGFCFEELTDRAITNTIGWAISTYYDRPEHLQQMVDAAMRRRHSWSEAAARYDMLYQWALERKSESVRL